MSLTSLPQRLLPVRGLICAHDAKGRYLSRVNLHRWIRLSRVVFKVHKLDILCDLPLHADFHDLTLYARGLHLQLSLRTNCESPPPDVETLRELSLLDVCLCPRDLDLSEITPWLKVCNEADLPVRVQLRAPFVEDARVDEVVASFSQSGVVSVSIVLDDPFSKRSSTANKAQCESTIELVNALARGLDAVDIEVNVFGLPKNLIPDDLHAHLGGSRQFFLDHQQYNQQAYELAIRLFDLHPYISGKVLFTLLARYTSANNPVDDLFLEFLFVRVKWMFFWVVFVRKLTRDLRTPFGKPTPLSDPEASYSAGLHTLAQKTGPDVDKKLFARSMPALVSSNDDWTECPEWRQQRKYYDAIDARRVSFSDRQKALQKQALAITTNRPPDKRVEALEYTAYYKFFEPLSGAVRWMAMTNREQISSTLGVLEAPYTATVTFGGGFAEYIGFAIGRHCKVVCPMTEFTHRLIIHVAEDGSYVLLRDDELMHPVEFEGQFYVPKHLLYPNDLLLSVWNIDESICSQSVDLWFGESTELPQPSKLKYSVVIFSTRFSRRLQFVLQSVIHQRGVSADMIEIVVGYVPGIDGTDDVIDSLRLSHPEFRIVRVPFPEQNIKSKGFVINECCSIAQGEWIVLLDSDVLLPPILFSQLEDSVDGETFLAPVGRHMLDKTMTARILVGELVPWRDWDLIAADAEDDRQGEAEGIPIGYCQIFKKSCLEKVRYAEYEHFERADSDFGLEMREEFGQEKRLEGVSLLHLEHGGSQWFGTYKNL